MTYAGWMEGVPSAEYNDRAVASATKQAETYCLPRSDLHLIAPHRRDYLRTPGDMAQALALGGRPAEWLPMVTCVGVLMDVSPARDRTKDQSYLTVLWYQHEYAPPIEETVFHQLRAIDWGALATDVEI